MATYTWDSTTDQDAILDRSRVSSNNAACDAIGIARGSTQAQCDAWIAAANAEDPPRLVGVTVNIIGNLQGYVRDVIRGEVKRIKALHKAENRAAFDAAVAAATPAQRDQIAALLGLGAGTV